MLNVASPDLAFKFAHLPNAGVGLAREEFIINNYIQAHPLALLQHKELGDVALSGKISYLINGYEDEETFFVKRLSYGIAKIAAAFYPNKVIVRFSDFKSNEYKNLLGGEHFEPDEENPMIGWRGASRYYSEAYKEAFGLECKAIRRVREKMGLKNVVVMVPFCRTVEELKKVKAVMEEYGLKRGKEGLELFLMAEVPSNIILAEEFSKYIDGFSIGSNDLTQLTLGLDRDSALVSAHLRRTQRGREGHAAHADHQRQEDRHQGGHLRPRPSGLPRLRAVPGGAGHRLHQRNAGQFVEDQAGDRGGGSEHGNERQGHGLSKLYDRAGTPGSPGRSACIVPSGSGNFSTRSLSHRSPGTTPCKSPCFASRSSVMAESCGSASPDRHPTDPK
jgi:hypothetical protein